MLVSGFRVKSARLLFEPRSLKEALWCLQLYNEMLYLKVFESVRGLKLKWPLSHSVFFSCVFVYACVGVLLE